MGLETRIFDVTEDEMFDLVVLFEHLEKGRADCIDYTDRLKALREKVREIYSGGHFCDKFIGYRG